MKDDLRFEPPLIAGMFVRRPNRFLADVELAGKLVAVHVPNSGRLQELLIPGHQVWVRPVQNQSRKTAYELVLVKAMNTLVAIDARLPNKLVASALAANNLPELAGFNNIKPEYRVGSSRFDFYLAGVEPWLVEVKCVTLVENGVARFPDAPTERGTKHLQGLIEWRQQSLRAAVIFVVQREDASVFAPNQVTDPLFASRLRQAVGAGVEILAYSCRVNLEKIQLDPCGLALRLD